MCLLGSLKTKLSIVANLSMNDYLSINALRLASDQSRADPASDLLDRCIIASKQLQASHAINPNFITRGAASKFNVIEMRR